MRQYDSKILRNRIVNDSSVLEALALKFGYRVGDLVKPVDYRKKKGLQYLRERAVRCSWNCNRERPVFREQGKYLGEHEAVIVLDMIDSSNGRLTVVMTHEGKPGFVLSSDLEKVQSPTE